jgi:lambda repressor-like predicted transcriptional regulator
MHAEEIKATIRMEGITPAMIAQELGVTQQTVSGVIHGKGKSQRIQKRISEVTGKSIEELWPPQPLMRRTPEQMQRTA